MAGTPVKSLMVSEGPSQREPTSTSNVSKFKKVVSDTIGYSIGLINSNIKSHIAILVDVSDAARVVFTPTVQYVPRGLKGIIRCETDANPPITYITWKKDSRLFDPFNTGGIMALLNGSLLIDQVSKYKL